jgi:LysR family transcriptional regulator, regulator for bpeEF and oprC
MTTIETFDSAASTGQITLRSLAVLQAVAAAGSFAQAGRQLGLTRAVVSQLVAQLETQLATQLFRRTTRQVALTEHGQALLARIGPALTDIHKGLQSTRAQSGSLAGEVNLSVSHALGRHLVLPALPQFGRAHPEVQVNLWLADRLDDLIVDSLDITVRMGDLPDSSLVAKRLGSLDVVLVATPTLLAQRGMPKSDEQLLRCPALGFRVPGSGQIYPWQVSGTTQPASTPNGHPPTGHTSRRITPARWVAVCNSIEAVADLVRLGEGIAAVPRFLVQADISAGQLQVLPRFKLPAIPVHLVFTQRALMPLRVRRLADYLADSLASSLVQLRAAAQVA